MSENHTPAARGDVDKTYNLILTNIYGQVCDRDGKLYRNDSGRPHFEMHFLDLEEARRYCSEVVCEHPHIECAVCSDKEIVFQHFDAEWRRAENERTRRLFSEQRRRDRIILTSILVGITTLVVGIILFFRR